MGLTARLQLRQAQSLVMTPQLMQSIKLLQLTHVELERFVDEEIERNPLLDRAEPREEASADRLPRDEPLADSDSAGDWRETEPGWTSEAMSAKLDSSLENLFPDDPGTSERLGPDLSAQWKSAGGGLGHGSADGFDMDDMAAAPVSHAEADRSPLPSPIRSSRRSRGSWRKTSTTTATCGRTLTKSPRGSARAPRKSPRR